MTPAFHTFGPLLVALLAGLAAYIALIALVPRRFLDGSTAYTRQTLQKLASAEPGTAWAQDAAPDPLSRLFFLMPGVKRLQPRLLKAGMTHDVRFLCLKCLIVFAIALYALKSLGPASLLLAVALTYWYGWRAVNRRITKRNGAFIEHFPDALDMIVRSVRSGYPMQSAIRMIADNMQPPVSTEFKQAADEIAYGSSLIDALTRLAKRIDEPDVHFFVVVLTVQQEIGGNLSEVLNNLATIIRKRKHLRMKIKALATEGKTTAWVLSSMPAVEILFILLLAPDHLTPLTSTPVGHVILTATLSAIGLGIFIVSRMASIKV